MRKITYTLHGLAVELDYSADNLALAQAEADDPEAVDIVEDGQPEAVSETDTLLELTADHEYRLCMLELGM